MAAELDVQRLRNLLSDAHPQQVRLAAYRLLDDHDLRTRLRTDLELIKHTNLALRARARTASCGSG
jgi:hypothetical protein